MNDSAGFIRPEGPKLVSIVEVRYTSKTKGPSSTSMDISDVATWEDLIRSLGEIVTETPLFFAEWDSQSTKKGNDYPVSEEDEYQRYLAEAGKDGSEMLVLVLNEDLDSD
jgi:hypothetical protein